MTLVLGVDFETTGLLPDKCEITEVGAVLWNWEKKKPVAVYNTLVQIHGDLSEEIIKLTGIEPDDLKGPNAVSLNMAMMGLSALMNQSDYVMAHNAQFDKGFAEEAFKKTVHGLPKRQWLCSREDIQYPKHCKSRSLTYLAADHGFINPFAHRALFDVLTMFKVAGSYDLAEIVRVNASPTVVLKSLAPFEDKDKVKSAGFHWKPEVKAWELRTKQCFLEETLARLDFKTVEIPAT